MALAQVRTRMTFEDIVQVEARKSNRVKKVLLYTTRKFLIMMLNLSMIDICSSPSEKFTNVCKTKISGNVSKNNKP